MKACVKGTSAVKDATSAADKKSTRKSAVDACKVSAKRELELTGGDPSDYERVQESAAREAVISAATACLRGKQDSAGNNVFAAATAMDECKTTAVKDAFEEAGGSMLIEAKTKGRRLSAEKENIHFDRVVEDAQKLEVGDRVASCMKSSDNTAQKCRDDGKKALKDLGGSEDDADVAIADAALVNVAASNSICLDLADGVQAEKEKCKAAAEKTFEKLGGDKDKLERVKQTGAAQIAKEQLRGCRNRADATKDGCRQEAKDKFKSAGGELGSAADAETFNAKFKRNVEIVEARRDASKDFLVCMKRELSGKSSYTNGEFKAAADKCKPVSNETYTMGGGRQGHVRL